MRARIHCGHAVPRTFALDPYEIKSALRAMLVPPAAPLLLVAIGTVWAWRGGRGGRAVALVGLAATWLACTPMLAQALALRVEAGQVPLDAAAWARARTAVCTRPPGAVVVLGGGAVADGPSAPGRERLTARSVQRAIEGARMSRQTGLPVLVTGGTHAGMRTAEGELLRELLERDLGTRVRWLEDRARDTRENATYSAALLRPEDIDCVVLVTHAYHMPRSRAAFESAGLKVVPAPHDWFTRPPDSWSGWDLWPSAAGADAVWLMSHELLGGLWYAWTGTGR